MTIILLALAILACCIGCLGLLSFARPTAGTTRLANIFGPAGAILGCALGLAGLFESAWAEEILRQLPWGLPFGQCLLGLDPLSKVFLLPVFGLGLVCALNGGISLRFMRAQDHNLAAHWLFYLLLVLGMAMVIMARDVVLFLLSWEVMSLSLFFLIDFNDGDRTVRDVSWLYLVAAHIGAVLLLVFFGLLWQNSGSTEFVELPLESTSGVLPSILFLLALFGFGTKAGLAPMHVWLPEVQPAAPSHISALLSGAMDNVGLYGIIRACYLMGPLHTAPAWWGWLILLMGIGTALMAILKALAQSNLKRMLAYSSIENMGLMLTGVGAWLIGVRADDPWVATLGLAGAVFHMLNHSAFKSLLFLGVGEVMHATGRVEMEKLGGLQKRMPLLGALFGIGAASIACFPPLNGFTGEFILALSLLGGFHLPGVEQQLGMLAILVTLGLISGLAAATYAKAYGITFLGAPRSQKAESPNTPASLRLWPLIIPAVCCVLGGLFSQQSFMTFIASIDPHLNEGNFAAIATGAGQYLGSIAKIGWIFLALVALFWFVRRLCVGKVLRRAETWGCGYQFGTARIQYTDAGFSEPLAKIFARAMGLNTFCKTDKRPFPVRGSLTVTAPDRLRSGFYTPLFEWIEQFCNSCKILQHGKIHIYLLYILATLVALLAWGLHA